MKFTQYLQEDKGSEQMVQKAFDKAHHDINKDANLPAKKSSPINQIQTSMGLEEEKVEPMMHKHYVATAVDFLESSIKQETKGKDSIDLTKLNEILNSFKTKLKKIELL